MEFENKFISGEELRKKWNIANRQQFFDIICFASVKINGDGNWLLRPHNPRNFKQVVFADGHNCPPHREDHGVIKDNYMPPEHETDLEKVIEYLDLYQYLISDMKTIEERFPELLKATEPEIKENKQSDGDYIKQSHGLGVKKEVIALTLKEKYDWSLLEIGRKLVCEGLQPDQIDALKKRAQRLIKKAKKTS